MSRPHPPKPSIRKPAVLIACACILQSLESMIPAPIPGVRLGLANAVTVVALADLGSRAALEVAILRTLLASLILGTFLSPTFLLSLSGAVTSTLVMAVAYRLGASGNRPLFSLAGISLIGAVTHNATQLALAYGLLVRHPGIFLMAPWLGLSAVATGWITGLIAMQACRRLGATASLGNDSPLVRETPHLDPLPRGERKPPLERLPAHQEPQPQGSNPDAGSPLPSGERARVRVLATESLRSSPRALASLPLAPEFVPAHSPLHRLSAAAKILAVLGISAALLCLHAMAAFAGVLVALGIAAGIGKVFSLRWFSSVFKIRAFLLFSFLAPLLLTRAGDVWLQAGPLVITREGATDGARIAWRLALLMLTTSLLVRTTAPEALAEGLRTVMRPLRWLRLPTDRMAATLSSAWALIPDLWDACQSMLRARHEKGTSWKQVFQRLGDTLAALYEAPEHPAHRPWRGCGDPVGCARNPGES
jgi:heptaprenyl diphosphate synthase